MNILLLSEFFPSSDLDITGGVENRAYYTAKELAKKNNVYVITSKQPETDNFEKFENIHVFRISPEFPYSSTGSLLKRSIFGLNACTKILLFCRKKNIKVVDAQSFFTYPAAIISNILSKKSFLTYHETWLDSWIKNTGTKVGAFGEIFERIILFFANIMNLKIISVSGFTKKKLAGNGYKKENIEVIHNGIELEKYRKVLAKKNKKTICYVGRLIKHKRVQDLIKSIEIIKKKIPGIRCEIIGEGPQKQNLIKLAKKCNVYENIRFLGYLKNHESVIKKIKSSSILVHPGTVEGFGFVLIEAMACSTPYVCSDIDVFLEVTNNGKGGLIFKRRNYKDLSEKILELLENKKLYKKKKIQAEKFAEKYNWKNIVEKIERIYEC
ncbi:glycosyltransferase [Candidatus Woesearchaeota archaeon]|nr:glycosyltransferase [Candidatus Woesearchaeota archaeon]